MLVKDAPMTTALDYLRTALGDPNADFREGQRECIEAAVRGERLLVVQRTGWGKSVVYFLATSLLRDAGAGPTLLISPLLSLMRNQTRRGGAARHPRRDHPLVESRRLGGGRGGAQANQVDVLMISPERLGNDAFLQKLLPLIGQHRHVRRGRGALHLRLGPRFPPGLPAHRALSAPAAARGAGALPRPPPPTTASSRTSSRRSANLHVLRGPLVRHSLTLYNIKLPTQADRLAWLAQHFPATAGQRHHLHADGAGRRRVAEWLTPAGHRAARLPRRPGADRASRPNSSSCATRSRRWSPPSRSAWASTSRTSGSSSTSSGPARSSPITSRWAAPGVRWMRPSAFS